MKLKFTVLCLFAFNALFAADLSEARFQELSLLAAKKDIRKIRHLPGEAMINVTDQTSCSFINSKLDEQFQVPAADLGDFGKLFPNGARLTRVMKEFVRLEEARAGECVYHVIFESTPLLQRSLEENEVTFCDLEPVLKNHGVTMAKNQIFLREQGLVMAGMVANESAVQANLQAINIEKLWDLGATGSYRLTAVIMDTGVDFNHPDLSGKVSTVDSLKFIGPDLIDRAGHGTFVAGIIGGRKTGIAKDVKMASFKVMEQVYTLGVPIIIGTSEDILAAYYHLLNNYDSINSFGGPIVVINSFGFYEDDPLITAAIKAGEKIFTVFAASGNDGSLKPLFPCRARDVINLVCVTSVDINFNLSSFGNIGSGVDIAAIGEYWISTYKGGYGQGSGTSFAAPAAAAVAGISAVYYFERGWRVVPQQLEIGLLRGAYVDRRNAPFFIISILRDAPSEFRGIGIPTRHFHHGHIHH